MISKKSLFFRLDIYPIYQLGYRCEAYHAPKNTTLLMLSFTRWSAIPQVIISCSAQLNPWSYTIIPMVGRFVEVDFFLQIRY